MYPEDEEGPLAVDAALAAADLAPAGWLHVNSDTCITNQFTKYQQADLQTNSMPEVPSSAQAGIGS